MRSFAPRPSDSADFVLFDADGNQLGRSTTEGTATVEELSITGIVPGERYYLTVLSRDYATIGYFDLDVQFSVHEGSISGVVFEDADADGVQDSGESGLGLWVVFIDENFNDTLDSGEDWVATDSTGYYEFTGLRLNTYYYVQARIPSRWKGSAPAIGYHHEVPTLSNPDRGGDDFGIYLLSSAAGVVFEDGNADGFKATSEPGMSGVTVFVDLDGDAAVDAGEPSALTDTAGSFLLAGIPAGTHEVRVEQRVGYVNTSPAGGVHTIAFGTNEARAGLDYGLHRPLDCGDAPEGDYHTLMASGGAFHTILAGFCLGATADSELDGQPTVGADGDDLAGDDEDGLKFLDPLIPGSTAHLEVTTTGSGVVDIWIDFNRTAGWEPGVERITGGGVTVSGTAVIAFAVPPGASYGQTYVRARFSGGGTSAPDGFGSDGEVEDYMVHIVSGFAFVDTDEDGVDDDFEAAHYGSKEHVGADDDTDHDGLDTREEWLFGTDPTDRASRFLLEVKRNGTRAEVSWPAIEGRRYRLERSFDLKEFEAVRDGLACPGGCLQVQDEIPDRRQAFYRVVISLPE